MPGVTIEVRRCLAPESERALIGAVAAAITSAFDIPESTLALRLVVHEPERFPLPRDKDERFTLITIDCFEGRSVEMKRALYAALATALGDLGIPADHMKVSLRESARENWGILGVPASGD
ncbi:MAG: tautomerase family protein [Burkholderiales bacterium]